MRRDLHPTVIGECSNTAYEPFLEFPPGKIHYPLGWWYNFVVEADEGVRVKLDGKMVLDAWAGEAKTYKFTRWLGEGAHILLVEYREGSGPAQLLVGWSAWPAQPVFAAETIAGPYEWLPASVTDYISTEQKQAASQTPTPAETEIPPASAAVVPTAAVPEATIEALQTQVASLSTALAQVQSRLTVTPAPAATDLIGKWELMEGSGDCFGIVDFSTIEFFADETYVGMLSTLFGSQPVGGRYTLLDRDRVRFEIPQSGFTVCTFAIREKLLYLTGPNMQSSRYVRYEEFPQQDYPTAIIGKWKSLSSGAKECLGKPFELCSSPDELILAPGGTFIARNYKWMVRPV
jgi:hypothetical protein